MAWLLAGDLAGGIWFAFISWFLVQTARSSYQELQLQQTAARGRGRRDRTGRRTARPRLASRAGHRQMRTHPGANQTWRAACTVSTAQPRGSFRAIDGLSVGLSLHR